MRCKFLFVFIVLILPMYLSAQGYEDKFDIGGFGEVVYTNYEHKDEDNSMLTGMLTDHSEFIFSSLNLYFNFRPVNNWQFFSEVKMSYSPSGETQATSDVNTSDGTIVLDSNGDGIPDAKLVPYDNDFIDASVANYRYNSLYIERAYVEWNRLTYATIRAGNYLTPYGLWSQDHGAPALTAGRVPVLVNSAVEGTGMPRNQTGVEIVGNLDLGIEVNYAAYIGNGRSVAYEKADKEDNNKGVGGFISFILPLFDDLLEVEFGGSYYNGESNILASSTGYGSMIYESLITLGADPTNPQAMYFDFNSSGKVYTVKQLDNIALGHLRLTFHGLPFDGSLIAQGEYMYHKADEDENATILNRISMPRTPKDYFYETWYAQVEYWVYNTIAPYFRYEKANQTKNDFYGKIIFEKMYIMVGGICARPVPQVTLKAEYVQLDFDSSVDEVVKVSPTVSMWKLNNDLALCRVSASMAF